MLVLPRPDEAIQMTDSGVPVETVEDGYDLKSDLIRVKLPRLKMDDPIRWTTRSLLFFNSAQEDPERLRTFLRGRIVDLRESHRVCLREIVAGANAPLDDLEREQAEEAVRQAWRPLAVWLDNDASLTGKPAAHVQDSLLRRRRRPTRRQSAGHASGRTGTGGPPRPSGAARDGRRFRRTRPQGPGQSIYIRTISGRTPSAAARRSAATAIATKSIDTRPVGSRPIRARMPIYEPSIGYRWSGPRRSRGVKELMPNRWAYDRPLRVAVP